MGTDSQPEIERNLGEQPLVEVLRAHELKAHDLVTASSEQITHKMITRGCKGRRLTANVQGKLLRAVNAATRKEFVISDLFNYR